MAYIQPTQPKVGLNELTTKVFTTDNDMMKFTEVKDYKILLDPRMPSMGNHSSPNNEDLTYHADKQMYMGKVNFTMSGYWKLNLQLENSEGNIVLGKAVKDDNEASNLYWEIEF